MKLSVIVATLEGCPFNELDDPGLIERALTEAVAAGGFTMLHCHVHRFEPQGVTGAAVLSESHVALHSWPEEGVLFVDLATCSDETATRRAFERICALVTHTTVREQILGYRGEDATNGAPAAWALVPRQRCRPVSRARLGSQPARRHSTRSRWLAGRR